MALVVPNASENLLLDWIFKSTSQTNVLLKLYSNSYDPVATSTAANFTECTFTGYTSGGKTLTRASWNASATNGAGKAEITYAAAQTWTASSSQAVYGYYCTDTSGNLLFAEKFATPRSLVSGDNLTITPKFTLSSEV